MRLPKKEYLTLAEAANRWGCNIDDVIYYIENDLLKLSAKMVVTNYTSDNVKAVWAIRNLTTDFEQKLFDLHKNFSSQYEDGNPLIDSPVSVSHDEIFDLDQDDKLEAKLHNYVKCFIKIAEIERFENENCVIDSQKKTPHEISGIHARFSTGSKIDNESILRNFIETVIADYPKATSKDIISHCFVCYQGNNRKLAPIKKIIADLDIDHGGSGKRTKESIDYMQKAPKYKPTQ